MPLMKISPASGSSRPATSLNVVVLPQPEGPSKVKISPDWIENVTPSTAATELKRFVTSRNSRTGWLIAHDWRGAGNGLERSERRKLELLQWSTQWALTLE